MVKKAKNKLLKIPAVINSRFLLSLLKVVTHGGLNVSRLSMVNTLLNKVDINAYSKDPEIFSIIKAIQITINCKIDDVKDHMLIVSIIESSISNADSIEIIRNLIEPTILGAITLQEQEISYVMGIISTYSKVGFMLEYKENIVNNFMYLETGSMYGIDSIVEELRVEIAELNMKLHKVLGSENVSITEPVSFNDPDFLAKQFKMVFDMSKQSSRVLKTGIKKFNEFLSKELGFLTGKMYTLNAPTNSFKTGLLLYIAKWIQLYNSDIFIDHFKKTGKRPTILVVSLENTWDENTERFFSMYVSKNMRDVGSLEEAQNLWKSKVYETDSCIDIVMIYGRAGRFSPADLEYALDELESQNRIVITTCLDYMRVMRDTLGNPDPRVKLVNIATDLHEIVAMRPHMALVTAHHTNRAGDEALTDVEQRGGVDKVKVLGRQHLTDAHAVEDPIDFSWYIALEKSPFTGEWYLTFKKGKCRYERSEVETFAHPLVNRFFLTDDINLPMYLSIGSIAETSVGSSGDNNSRSSERSSNVGQKGKTSMRDASKDGALFSSDVLE